MKYELNIKGKKYIVDIKYYSVPIFNKKKQIIALETYRRIKLYENGKLIYYEEERIK